ncbi:sensor domain-containing protein [Mycobacterium sp. ACS4331]|uniref:sensor domain-containing protein n=1 Tax=Mycobacterium sp. ACS4331 TaxID=1834121 RepID=UPI0018D2B554|nr:sensor domain-containing protein [Mycobacterium sp. ACS4331]
MTSRRLSTAVLSLAVLITGCTSVVSGGPVKDPTPPPLVAIANLKTLLAPLPEIKSTLDAPNLKVLQVGDTVSEATLADGGVPSLPECLGVMYPARATAYAGSGYSGLQGERLGEDPAISEHVAIQVVVAFPTIAQAEDAFDTMHEAWDECADKSLTTTFDAGVETFVIGTPVATDSTLAAVSTQVDGGGWACSRALGRKANVIADVNACQLGVTDQGERIMTEILRRIPG